jgi:hypothetical protein
LPSSTASTGNTTPVGVTTTLGPDLGAWASAATPSGGLIVVVVVEETVGALADVGSLVAVDAGTDVDAMFSPPTSAARSADDVSAFSLACDAHDAASAITNSAGRQTLTQDRR